MAAVMVLTDPIPRHVSIVGWGANDRPAVSWKSAISGDPEGASISEKDALRDPPTPGVVASVRSAVDVKAFVDETLNVWKAVVMSTLGVAITAAERSARIQGLTAQAGARVAAFAAAVGQERLKGLSWDIEPQELPTQPTMSGELDRRAFLSVVSSAAEALSKNAVDVVKDPVKYGFSSTTEAILSGFSSVGQGLASLAATMPSGVVGVSTTMNAGKRNSSSDEALLRQMLSILKDLIGDDAVNKDPKNNASSTEKSDMLTIENLKQLASEDPQGFLETFRSAFDAVKQKSPAVAKKFVWGETGVDQYDAEAILSALRQVSSGDALVSLIAQAVGGIDVGRAAGGDSPQVAATMRSAINSHVLRELKSNPTGELATSVKALVAADVGRAIAEAIKSVMSGNANSNPAGAGFGLDDFEIDNDSDPLAVELPGLNKMVR
jgi:hypothetical protein